MRIAPMGQVRNNFARYLTESEEEPVFVTRNGKVVAVIECMKDEDIEDFLLERSPQFRAMLRRVRREPGGTPLAQYRKSHGV